MLNIIYRDNLSPEHQKIIIDSLNDNAYKQKDLGADNGSFSFAIDDKNGNFQGWHFWLQLLWVFLY